MGFFDAAKAASKATAKGTATGKTGSGKGLSGLLEKVRAAAEGVQEAPDTPEPPTNRYANSKDFGRRRANRGMRRSR